MDLAYVPKDMIPITLCLLTFCAFTQAIVVTTDPDSKEYLQVNCGQLLGPYDVKFSEFLDDDKKFSLAKCDRYMEKLCSAPVIEGTPIDDWAALRDKDDTDDDRDSNVSGRQSSFDVTKDHLETSSSSDDLESSSSEEEETRSSEYFSKGHDSTGDVAQSYSLPSNPGVGHCLFLVLQRSYSLHGCCYPDVLGEFRF